MDSVRVLYFLFFIFCFVFYVLYFVFCILYKHVIHDIQRTRASYPCQPTAEMGHFVFGIFDWVRGGWVIFWHQHLNWGSILCRSEHLYHRIFDWDKGRVEGRRVISWHQHLNCAGTSIHKSRIWDFADSIICCACKLMSGYWTLFIQGSGRREDHLLTSTSKVCIVHFSWMLFQINSVTVPLSVYPN